MRAVRWLACAGIVLGPPGRGVAAPCRSDDLPCLEAAVRAQPADWRARRALGEALANAAVLGVQAAADEAGRHLRAVVEALPQDAYARVLLGWALVLQAREAPAWRMRALAEEGFRELDAAVAAAPADPAVRFVRARNDYQMPRAAGRLAGARTDFARLVALARAGEVGPELRRAILFHAGAFALKERRADAVALLEEAAAVPGPTPSEDVMQSMLALAREALTPPADAQGPQSHEAAAP